MDDLTFLDQFGDEYESSNATLKAVLSSGQVCHISDRINPYRLLDICPLLYHAFEYGSQARLQANIEAPSRTAVISLLRYCYTGSYLPPGAEHAPILFLPHAETYKMAEDFDIPELQLLAHGKFSCQVEFACSLPIPPQDLLETIRYVYVYFASPQARQQQGLVHTLLNYCISVFQYHRLAESVEFLEIVQHIPEFRQDLCRTNMERNFQDDCAFDIIRLALDTLQPQPNMRPTTLASRDLPQEMLFDRPATLAPTEAPGLWQEEMNAVINENGSDSDVDIETATRWSSVASGHSTLVFRPKNPQPVAAAGFETDSSSEDEGFSIIHRPKLPAIPTPEDLMSTPEMVPSQPIDILALSGSNYPQDDEWTML